MDIKVDNTYDSTYYKIDAEISPGYRSLGQLNGAFRTLDELFWHLPALLWEALQEERNRYG